MPIYALTDNIYFPPPDTAEANGLLAFGGDLSPVRLLNAYRLGIFPWYSEGEPILWWSPDPRLVLLPAEFHLSRRLARTLRGGRFTVSADRCFAQVIARCAATRLANREGTWITQEMQEAYCLMHTLGYAHSVECWQDGCLVGGLYGMALDQVFFGESMFSLAPDASKAALATLVYHAEKLRIGMIDCQMRTEHLLRLGAVEMPRADFQRRLQHLACHIEPQPPWVCLSLPTSPWPGQRRSGAPPRPDAP
ncbi:MAG: leucyl/phenylalanyl-tRNA--protein transferase [Desulfobulbaceae bacterium A2]|nr:MAG: leucyl/phenylalanyl-tRNA--protein transferase [Desulfobulbaceae bacterium A2]